MKMTVLTIILGILMIMCGVSCTFTPLSTFFEAGTFIIVLLLVYGIAGIVRAVMIKEYGLNFVFAIISVIAGLLILCIPGLRLMTDSMLLYMMAGWFIIQGIVSIFMSLRIKQYASNKNWIWGIAVGIAGVIIGIYSCIHPVVLMFSIGVLIGVYFIVTGVNMIMIAVQNNR